MMRGHRIDEIGRSSAASGRSGRQWSQPEPERFDAVRAKVATDLAGLLILLSMVVGSLIALS